MATITQNTENPITKFWESSYIPIDPQTHLSRKWKLPGDVKSPISIIQLLPDEQKPHLPEGHLWFKDQNDLKILKHIDAPTLDFKIYIFGPDKQRIQYLVTQNVAGTEVPTHGFAMARREGFSKTLRNEYPITLESFQEGTTTKWRVFNSH